MLTNYIFKKLNQAHYKILEDGAYFGEIPGLQGVWASEKTLEKCRENLREVLEEWLILKLQDGDSIPGFSIKKVKHKVLVPNYA
ncbi:type II toxin-antitoxin system HicB family antitoxin [Candidatus Parcubacteria bacterium]|nr:type II toxin-antitoxin system HicB family antitoxin [Candidatus Parcubacteria bacterium]